MTDEQNRALRELLAFSNFDCEIRNSTFIKDLEESDQQFYCAARAYRAAREDIMDMIYGHPACLADKREAGDDD